MWQDASTDSVPYTADTGLYFEEVVIGTCSASDTIQINAGLCDIVVPNIFSPNGDGVNDVFSVEVPLGELTKAQIYNRWGQHIYEFWDGGYWDGRTTLGEIAPEGTYMYVLEIEVNGQVESRAGTLYLSR